MNQNNSVEISILYLDDDIVCINKPAGILSVVDGYEPSLPYLASLLQSKLNKVWVVHRLDRETSGVMILARNKTAHSILNQQFENRLIKKEYLAITIGKPSWTTHTVELPLQIDGDRKHRTIVSNTAGKSAKTIFRVISTNVVYGLVMALPYSGYTHQIRAHLAAIHLPVLSDALYQRGTISPPIIDQLSLIPRIALHAYNIQILHPTTNAPITFKVDPPPDFTIALTQCGLEL
jgi:RluA family pseudouridine synthase